MHAQLLSELLCYNNILQENILACVRFALMHEICENFQPQKF